jgi:hypothetical protein
LPKLAHLLGLGLNTVRRYLSGERAPTKELLDRLREETGLARGGCASVPVPETTIASQSGTLLGSNYGEGSGLGGKFLDSNYGEASKVTGTPPWLAPRTGPTVGK